MIELEFKDFHIVESLFLEKMQHIPALSVIHGNYPGRVFVDNEVTPSVAIVWAIGRWMYAEGNIVLEKNRTEIKHFIQNIVIPDCLNRNEQWFEIYTSDSEQWDRIFLEELDGLEAHKHFESTYELNENKFLEIKNARCRVEDKVQVVFEQYHILTESFYNLPYVKESYQTLKTIGAVVKIEDRVVSICKNNGFVFGNKYFIDADTFEIEERSKGYGSLAAVQLIDYFLGKGMYPLWETTHQNLPSHKLALKLGFEPVESYPVYAFIMNTKGKSSNEK